MALMDAAGRWQALVTARMAEVEEVAPGRGPMRPEFWNRRARGFARTWPAAEPARDPFLKALRRVSGAATTAVDVGAGTGRYALAIAPRIAHLQAVDLSATMLASLRRAARQAGITNISTVERRWETAAPDPADICYSSFVMTLVPDAPAFVRRMNECARKRALLYLGAYSDDAVLDPLWRHFHGRPRRPGPTYLDAVGVLREIGLRPHVEVFEVPYRYGFDDMAGAVRVYRDRLLLPPGPAVGHELRRLLGDWLVVRKGRVAPPISRVAAAVISWEPTYTPGP